MIVAALGAVVLGVTIAAVLAPRLAGHLAHARDALPVEVARPAPPPAPGVASIARGAPDPTPSATATAAAEEPHRSRPHAASAEIELSAVSLSSSSVDLDLAPSAEAPAPTRAVSVPELRLTTTQRVHRVDAPRMRERTVEAATSTEALPELEASAVQRVVQRQQARLRQCYTTAVRRSGDARDARVQLVVDIAPAGSVSDVAVSGEPLGEMGVCLRRTALRWQFPASRSGARVPVPLSFTALH
ncbi:MAG: AgmX/PglI C-terminal domain-containing protein [Sandaracinaceae bacterium]